MPYVNIRITREGGVTAEQKQRLISGVTELLREVLNKNPATTGYAIAEPVWGHNRHELTVCGGPPKSGGKGPANTRART